MAISPLAGKPAPQSMLIDPARLVREYFVRRPDVDNPAERVSFGTSGHRGSAFAGSFNEAHVLAITQALCDYRKSRGIDGPLYMGKDTHALSEPAQGSALEVLAANGVDTVIQRDDGATPTPVISRAILVRNRGRSAHLADGIVITPSHNPPEDGGFKYNPPDGGPADSAVTRWVQDRANELLRGGNAGVKRVGLAAAMSAATTHCEDLVLPYVSDLGSVIDMDAIRAAGLKLAVDPLGGAAMRYWEPINAVYKLDITVVTRPGDTLTLDTVGRSDFVRIGEFSVEDIRGDVEVRNSSSVTELEVWNLLGKNFAPTVQIDSQFDHRAGPGSHPLPPQRYRRPDHLRRLGGHDLPGARYHPGLDHRPGHRVDAGPAGHPGERGPGAESHVSGTHVVAGGQLPGGVRHRRLGRSSPFGHARPGPGLR